MLVTVTVFLGGSLSGFARRSRTGPQILGALLASQLAFHLAFSLTAHPMARESGIGGGAERMIAFHVVGAVVASWVMASGESTVFRLFAALHRVLLIAPTAPTVGVFPSWTALIPTGTGGVGPSAADLSTASRRGPPLGTTAHCLSRHPACSFHRRCASSPPRSPVRERLRGARPILCTLQGFS